MAKDRVKGPNIGYFVRTFDEPTDLLYKNCFWTKPKNHNQDALYFLKLQ